MEEGHIEKIAALEEICFSSPWSVNMVRGEFLNKNATYLIYELDGEFCAYLGMHKILDEGYITNIAVSPEYRRRGIAKALLERLIEENRDLSFITLEVRESNLGAIALYEGMGFEKVGARPHYYTNPDETAILMTWYKEK